jgi:dihydroorotase
MARKVLAAGIRPYTLGADMHGYNVRLPEESTAETSENPFFGFAPFNLTHSMTDLLTLGMTLPDIVATVTINPARMLKLDHEIGALTPGFAADVSVLDVMNGRFTLSDNSGEQVTTDRMIVPVFCLRDGIRHDVDSPLVPMPLAA